jgi:hypothetical protein
VATGLEVWIAAPGSACTVDDGPWVVTVYDAHDAPFSWSGDSYAGLEAPHAHWVGPIPPGTYVVGAVQKDGPLVADSAVVTVGCQEVACVRLHVRGERPDTPPDPSDDGECRIAIRSVSPFARDRRVLGVEVTGVAYGCDLVELTVACGSHEVTTTADVDADRSWSTKVDTSELKCECGGPVRVVARCARGGDCFDVREGTLDCDDEQQRDVLR